MVQRRQIERLEAEVAQLKAEKADVEAFAAVAAHELIEPLVMIEAYSSLAMKRIDDDPGSVREDLDTICRAAARLRRLGETLLYDARSGGRALRPREVDCNALLRDIVAILLPEIEARSARVELGDLPTVRGEEALLGSVFTNLLSNALRYGPRAGALVTVTGERGERGWDLTVEDDGPAIAEEERERIFEPFRHGQRERRDRGFGLGLAISRRISERHGGQIAVAPGTRGGNRFVLSLPDAA
jgi:signal transduction histidine kinase